jgi:hypothetical protein
MEACLTRDMSRSVYLRNERLGIQIPPMMGGATRFPLNRREPPRSQFVSRCLLGNPEAVISALEFAARFCYNHCSRRYARVLRSLA